MVLSLNVGFPNMDSVTLSKLLFSKPVSICKIITGHTIFYFVRTKLEKQNYSVLNKD